MTFKMAFFDAKPYDVASFDIVNKEFNAEITYFTDHPKMEILQ